MALIVAARPDPFRERMKTQKAKSMRLNSVGFPKDYSHVRRPFRGMLPKGDTYATLDVTTSEGVSIPLLNSGAREPREQLAAIATEGKISGALEKYDSNPADGRKALKRALGTSQDYETVRARDILKNDQEYTAAMGLLRKANQKDLSRDSTDTAAKLRQLLLAGRGASYRYSNFLLTSVQEARQEKYQVMETFGAPFIFFFGERPRIYTFQGVLLNSLDFQWRTEFWANYDQLLRGTRLVEMGARVTITWDDIIAEGYILQASASEDAMQPRLVNLNFQMFITNYQTTANLGDPNFPSPAAVSIDTAYWKNSDDRPGAKDKPYTSNVDRMRRKNLEEAAKQKSPGLLGYLAMGLGAAATVATMVTEGLESFVKSFETVAAGRDLRYPVGAFPLVSEIQSNPALQELLKGTNPYDTPDKIAEQVAAGISPETRRLIQVGADDPAGLPTFFVQDETLIVDLTKKYNNRAVRKVKILPPGGVFSKPTNANYFGGFIRDNEDEYVQQVIASVEKLDAPIYSRDPLAEFADEEKRLTDIIAHMIKKFRAFGAPMTDADMLTQMTVREGSSGALRLGMSAGGIAQSFNSTAPPPDLEDVIDTGDVAAAQRVLEVWNQKQAPSTEPKADLTITPVGQPETVKVITPNGIEKRPKVRKPTVSGASINDPEKDKATLERLLKQARRRSALTSTPI